MVPKKSSSKMMEEDLTPETDVSKDFINFLVDELKDIYWGEKHLSRALPKIQKAAMSKELKDAFAGLLSTAPIKVERLEQVFELLGETPRTKKSEAIAGFIEEANGIMEEKGRRTSLKDTGLMLAVQKIDHYKITTYETLVQLARTMGNEDIISLLEETLSEEKVADEVLTTLAERGINSSATEEDLKTQKEEGEKIAAVYDSKNLTGKKIKRVEE